jgi:hypothetical protein
VGDIDAPTPLSVVVLVGAFALGAVVLSPVGLLLATIVYAVKRWP